ncbi:Sir2 family NAD-dependent protein deacetylase [Micromonospora echinofusca]|uniref:SIR2 family NAD-dependent protein deacylase n=1 Tax=Micromonospora echinofusca TaxID=47858 RepID=UPI0020204722|nr:Sir2 family NAD-dependent protein deacetylase [Micromonospora sp. MSM11]MCL7456074.1 NAD-dependent deacylase [Micromonospora sp. MSM11]
MREAAALLAQARRVVVFTGAGISAESGVPTFRDALTGLWRSFDARRLATPDAFRDDPALVWGWYEWRRATAGRARPNAGHVAVAAIEARVPHAVVVTQNVDDLHERAGSVAPIHLHGSLSAPRCSACARPAPLPAEPPLPDATSLSAEAPPLSGGATLRAEPPLPSGTPDEHGDGRRVAPPRCAHCAGPVRPGVVWFGEALPSAALEAAVEAASACDLLLTVGTSGLVYPAAEIPRVAARFGALVVQVNPEETPLDAVADVNLRGPAAQVLPALVRAAWGAADPA